MDPASIVGLVAACVGLVDHSLKATSAVRQVIQACNEARRDLLTTTGNLRQIELVMHLFKDDLSSDKASKLPESLRDQLLSVIEECNGTLRELDRVLSKYKTRSQLRWAVGGKDKIQYLNRLLNAHIRSFSLSIDMAQMYRPAPILPPLL